MSSRALDPNQHLRFIKSACLAALNPFLIDEKLVTGF